MGVGALRQGQRPWKRAHEGLPTLHSDGVRGWESVSQGHLLLWEGPLCPRRGRQGGDRAMLGYCREAWCGTAWRIQQQEGPRRPPAWLGGAQMS